METGYTYKKRAVKHGAGAGIVAMYLDCECGHKLSLPTIAGMPMMYECLCGLVYDRNGWILGRREAPCDK